ncbi:MAG: AzlD family protein [Geminicoccaceae bacterium]
MSDPLLITALLAVATFSTRFLGVVLGQHLPESGPWTRALNALPGCLILSLVTVMLVGGGPDEWIGAAVALGVAFVTRSLPLTMIAGIAVVWMLRTHF